MNERDPDLEKLYREHSREEPSPALDAAILAAAHRAVESAPRKVGAEATRPQRWWMPLATAATIGVVAIGVIQQMPKETALDATSVAPATAPVAAPQAPPPPAQAQAPVSVGEPKSAPIDVEPLAKKQKEADASRRAQSPPPAAPAAKPAPEKTTTTAPPPPGRDNKVAADKLAVEPTPFPAAAAPPPQKSEAASVEAKRDMPMQQPMADARKDSFREERQAAAPAAAAPPPAAAPVPAPAPAPSPAFANRLRAPSENAAGALGQSKNVEEEMRTLARDPDAWIARIRKLRDDGNTAQALRELKEFRALVPDAERRLPPDLRNLQP